MSSSESKHTSTTAERRRSVDQAIEMIRWGYSAEVTDLANRIDKYVQSGEVHQSQDG